MHRIETQAACSQEHRPGPEYSKQPYLTGSSMNAPKLIIR